MKKHVLILLSITFLLFSCHKDVKQQILGKWEINKTQVINIDEYLKNYQKKFKVSKDELEQEKSRIKALPDSYFPKGIIMEFDDSSKFYLGGIEGKWTYYPDKNKIKIKLALIDSTMFKIKKISNKDLILTYNTNLSEIPLIIELKLNKVETSEQ